MRTVNLLLILLLTTQLALGVLSAKFTITSKCRKPIYPATLTASGKQQQLSITGFPLMQGESRVLDSPPAWKGKIWARTNCPDFRRGEEFRCQTGDCGTEQVQCNGNAPNPPATVIRFTLGGLGGEDSYDVSVMDGFNLPVTVTPQGKQGCPATGCPVNINKVCPPELSIKIKNNNTVGCQSACDGLKNQKYCCTGDYGSKETCLPNNYSTIFKKACPRAYTYPNDDKGNTFTCSTVCNHGCVAVIVNLHGVV